MFLLYILAYRISEFSRTRKVSRMSTFSDYEILSGTRPDSEKNFPPDLTRYFHTFFHSRWILAYHSMRTENTFDRNYEIMHEMRSTSNFTRYPLWKFNTKSRLKSFCTLAEAGKSTVDCHCPNGCRVAIGKCSQ